MTQSFSANKLKEMRKNVLEAEKLLKLLANSKRLLILCHLLHEEKTVSELQECVGLSQSALSQHLARLKQQKILTVNKVGTKSYYKLTNTEVQTLLSTLYLIFCK